MSAVETEAVYKAMLDARELLDSGEGSRKGRQAGERCIAFRVADEVYAVDLIAVREVIVPPAIVHVPGAGPEVLGVINLRGSVVTVINSRTVLGLGGKPEDDRRRILVLDEGSGCVGVLVDAVEDIIVVDPDELQALPEAGQRRPPVQVRGALALRDDSGNEQIAFVMRGAALAGAPASG